MKKRELKHPEPFLETRVHDLSKVPGLITLCAGYENGEWRYKQLAVHLLKWLPEFALSIRERESISYDNALEGMTKAAKAVYSTKKKKNRGEIGEILLHIALRQVFCTIPAISKYFYKDSANDTIKGFDSVHITVDDGNFQLWLGEVKFYKDINKAIRMVIKEIRKHLARNYLRNEFAFISSKVETDWEHEKQFRKLISENTSLDKIFNSICIPVLLTYESSTIASHKKVSEAFIDAIQKESYNCYDRFCKNRMPKSLKVHLFLLPMKSKKALVDEFDVRLKLCQSLTTI
jgi:hypothetical protein